MREQDANERPLFTRLEHLARLERVRGSMVAQGLDLLLISDPCNIYYLTGYDGWSFYTPQFLLVSLDDDPAWIGREMDVVGMRMLSWLAEDSIVGYQDNLVQSTAGHPVEVLADYINAHRPSGKLIGVEKNCYYLTVESYEVLSAKLKNKVIVDASLLVNWVRFVKSPEEIRIIQQAAKLLDLSMSAAMDVAVPGARECDVAAAAYAANITGTDDFGGVYTSSPAFISSGERAAAPHLCWTDRRIGQSTFMNLELMGNARRYQVTMARSICFGEPAAELRSLESVVLEGIEQVMDFIEPGVTCEEVEGIWRKCIGKYGVEKESRCGYSQGIAFPPTGGELTASFRPGDKTVLQPNTVMHFLPAIWSTEQSLTISEPIRVTESGCERLSKFPRKLIVKDNDGSRAGSGCA